VFSGLLGKKKKKTPTAESKSRGVYKKQGFMEKP